MRRPLRKRPRATVPPPPPAGAFFTDNFSTGDLTKTEGGFAWQGASYVSIINTATVGLPATPGGSNRAAYFNFVDNFAELNFSLVASNAAAGYSQMFLRYYAYYPTGAEGGTVGPEWRRTATFNNKALRLFDTVLHADRTIGFGASTYGVAVSGNETLIIETGAPTFYNSPGYAPNATGQEFTFVSAATRGAWRKIEYQFTMPTVTPTGWGVGNGIFRMYLDDVLRIESLTASQSDVGGVMRGGYLMGACNSPYDNANSKMYITDFAVSSTGRV